MLKIEGIEIGKPHGDYRGLKSSLTYWKKLKEEQTTIETLLALNLRKKGKQLPDRSK